ncbi:MAG TPA: hypothetical protein VNL70_07485, partial [Tepidisphaeraceae bacterium]|nr:hypothetical protein [Tepidisphaeraceae bacterium]
MKRSAFTVTEMLFSLGILAVAGLLMARIFTGSIRAIEAAHADLDRAAAADRFAAALKTDVWNASSIQSPDPATLILTLGDGTGIRWSLADDGTVTRIADSAPGSRWSPGERLQIQVQGPSAIIVHSTTARIDRPQQWR